VKIAAMIFAIGFVLAAIWLWIFIRNRPWEDENSDDL
jgi:hypothetical protein